MKREKNHECLYKEARLTLSQACGKSDKDSEAVVTKSEKMLLLTSSAQLQRGSKTVVSWSGAGKDKWRRSGKSNTVKSFTKFPPKGSVAKGMECGGKEGSQRMSWQHWESCHREGNPRPPRSRSSLPGGCPQEGHRSRVGSFDRNWMNHFSGWKEGSSVQSGLDLGLEGVKVYE